MQVQTSKDYNGSITHAQTYTHAYFVLLIHSSSSPRVAHQMWLHPRAHYWLTDGHAVKGGTAGQPDAAASGGHADVPTFSGPLSAGHYVVHARTWLWWVTRLVYVVAQGYFTSFTRDYLYRDRTLCTNSWVILSAAILNNFEISREHGGCHFE